LVTITYVLANVAYLSVLDPVALVASDAVAVTLADRMLGAAAVLVPVLVAVSAFGGLSCHIMTSSRLCFVGARQGHFPDCLSLITLDTFTPKPALVFLVKWYGILCEGLAHMHVHFQFRRSSTCDIKDQTWFDQLR